MKTIHVRCRSNKDVIPVVRKALRHLGPYRSIGIVSTSQHLHALPDASKVLSENGISPVICGQVLGCNPGDALKSREKIDAYLFIGSGSFHPLGLMAAAGRPVISANPYSCEVSLFGEEDLKKKQRKDRARMMRAASAGVYGILVSTKRGQSRMKEALRIKSEIESCGKEAYIFAGEEINPDRTLGMKVGAWVNTACPRIVDDLFDKAAVNPDELRQVLPKKTK